MSLRQTLASIIARLRRVLLTRENLLALVLALLIILTFTCATTGVQPRFVYTGF